MLIRCPNCNTSYKLPGERIGPKPVKMRCHHCGQIFTVTRRSNSPPTGYEEYAGKVDALPSDFAFLREAPSGAETKPDTFVGVPPASREVTPKPSDAKPDPEPTENVAPKSAEPPPEITKSSGSFEIYDSQRSAWESAVPFELAGHMMSSDPEETDTTRLAGKVMSLITALLIIFFIFVFYRNGWSLGFSNLPEQIGVAFSSRAHESFPEATKSIELQILDKKNLKAKDGSELILVSGTVFNNATTKRSNIILRGGFRDKSGELRSFFEAPCGQTITPKSLVSVSPSNWKVFYEKNGKTISCHMAPESTIHFELPLAKPGSGCEHESCDIEVVAIFAEVR